MFPQRGDDVHLMNATLDIYTQIFSSILHHSNHSGLLDHLSDSKRTEVHADLTKLQKKMRELKSCRSQQFHLNHSTETALKELSRIQVMVVSLINTWFIPAVKARGLKFYSTVGVFSCKSQCLLLIINSK